LKSREQDIFEQKEKIRKCEEKLLRTKQLYDSISSQMISLKQNIASSRVRVHNRGDLQEFDLRINQLLVRAENAAAGCGNSHDEKEFFAADQTALTVSDSSVLMMSANKVCVHHK
jgi:hypothetical protein